MDSEALLVVVPVVLGNHSIFNEFQVEPLNFWKKIDNLCNFMDFKGFGHHSDRIATGATGITKQFFET